MELDELKESWKKIGETNEKFDRDLVSSLVKGDSQSPLVKIRMSMVREIVLFILLLGIMYLYYFLFSPNRSDFAFFSLGVFCAVSIFISLDFYKRLFKRTRVLNSDQSIYNQLSRNIQLLRADIKNYKFLTFVMYLPALFVSLLLSDEAFTSFDRLTEFTGELWLIFISVTLLLFPIYYWFVNWFTNQFYSKYVTELEEMKQELEQE